MSQTAPMRERWGNASGQLPLVEKTMWRILRGGKAVFMFHRILPPGEECYDPELVTSTDAFAGFLDWLSENYRVLPIDELMAARGKSVNPGRPLCAITFDDGWVDNYLHACPLLYERQLPATIFLPLRFIGAKRRFWQEQLWQAMKSLDPELQHQLILNAACGLPWFPPAAKSCHSLQGLKRFLLTRPSQEAEEFVHRLTEAAGLPAAHGSRAFLDWNEVEKMQGMGISFGSHTVNHVLLTHMEPASAAGEIRQSREELMGHLKEEVPGFAYPWGA